MKRLTFLSIAIVAFAASAAGAQGRSSENRARGGDIPVSARPPAGMCRIWLDDVPISHQPAPTDCASAVRNRPSKGRVIFGDDYVRKGRPADTSRPTVPIKGFSPPQRRP